MIRIPDLTLSRLLDHVEAHALRVAAGKRSIPARAFAADAEGVVTVFGFPVPASTEDRRALAAILQAEMTKREAVMSVLLLPAQVRVPGGTSDPIDAVVLEGQQIRPRSRVETRVLAVERQGKHITDLRRMPSPDTKEGSAAPGHAALN